MATFNNTQFIHQLVYGKNPRKITMAKIGKTLITVTDLSGATCINISLTDINHNRCPDINIVGEKAVDKVAGLIEEYKSRLTRKRGKAKRMMLKRQIAALEYTLEFYPRYLAEELLKSN